MYFQEKNTNIRRAIMNGQVELLNILEEIELKERREVINQCQTCQYQKCTLIIHWRDDKGNPKDIIKRNWIHKNCLECKSYFCKTSNPVGINKDYYKKIRSMYKSFNGKYDIEEIEEERAEKLKRYNMF